MMSKIYYFFQSFSSKLIVITLSFLLIYMFDTSWIISMLSNLVHIFVYSSVVLTCKLNGNETMDAITALYTEVIFLCYVIVLIVIDILLTIESRFSTHYVLNDEFVVNKLMNIDSVQTTLFSFIPIRYSVKGESFLDIAFLLFPTAVIFYIVVPTLGFLYNKDINVEAMSSSFTIDVVGHQWYWSYGYNIDFFSNMLLDIWYIDPPEKLEFDSIIDMESNSNRLLSVNNVMVIPSHTSIRLSLTSTDVIHSWAIPQLGIKVDTIPGRITTCNLYTYTVSTFYGQCSELCGASHGFMPIVLESVPLDIFFDWYVEALELNCTGKLNYNILTTSII